MFVSGRLILRISFREQIEETYVVSSIENASGQMSLKFLGKLKGMNFISTERRV